MAGVWVVSHQWMQVCLETRTIVDAQPYELLGLIIDGIETPTGGPKRSRERREAQELPLYDGCNFHFHAGTTAFSTEVSMLQTLASGAGGAIVSRPELDAAAASQDDGSSTRLFVVVADDSEDDLSGFAEVCIVVEESFIIESLEGYEALDANKYYPGNSNANESESESEGEGEGEGDNDQHPEDPESCAPQQQQVPYQGFGDDDDDSNDNLSDNDLFA